MKKWAAIGLIIFGLLLFGISFWGRDAELPQGFSGLPGLGSSPAGRPASPGEANSSSGNGMDSSAEAVNPAFSLFLRQEGEQMDRPANPESAEARLKAQAEAMGEGEIAFAKSRALAADAPAGERIVSVFLLGLTGTRGSAALAEVAKARLPERDVAPHTVSEAKAMQEKALQRMAVDALAEQARKDPQALRQLEEAAAESPDPDLRAYILRKIREARQGL